MILYTLLFSSDQTVFWMPGIHEVVQGDPPRAHDVHMLEERQGIAHGHLEMLDGRQDLGDRQRIL